MKRRQLFYRNHHNKNISLQDYFYTYQVLLYTTIFNAAYQKSFVLIILGFTKVF